MRIVTKMTLALIATGLVSFGAYAVYFSSREAAHLRALEARELQVLGRTLQVAIENALRDAQIDDVHNALDYVEPVDPRVRIALYDRHGSPHPAARGHGANASEAGAALPPLDGVVRFEPLSARMALPLHDEHGGRIGAIVLDRSITDMHAAVAQSRADIILSALLFMLLAAAVGSLVGRLYIGRPLNELMDAMRHVREGDLSQFLRTRRRDETREVAITFNEMLRELAVARQRLEDEASRRRQLERALQQADKLVAVGQLAATLAHEVGSPLQVLIGRAQALVDRDYPRERIRQHADTIASQGQRIAGIVERLLGYARRRPQRRQHIRPSEPILAVLELLEVEAKQRRIQIESRIEPTPRITCDPHGLQQVVFNLVRNALRFTPAGGHIRVHVRTSTWVPDDVRSPSTSLVVQVSDNGPGIDPAHHTQVFEPFFTTCAEEGGTGLGLAVVKAIVEEHDGSVAADSTPEGASFTVRLPFHQAQQEPPDGEATDRALAHCG